jgi:hypothetical protein
MFRREMYLRTDPQPQEIRLEDSRIVPVQVKHLSTGASTCYIYVPEFYHTLAEQWIDQLDQTMDDWSKLMRRVRRMRGPENFYASTIWDKMMRMDYIGYHLQVTQLYFQPDRRFYWLRRDQRTSDTLEPGWYLNGPGSYKWTELRQEAVRTTHDKAFMQNIEEARLYLDEVRRTNRYEWHSLRSGA